jgi:excisionase family DNA binding protein
MTETPRPLRAGDLLTADELSALLRIPRRTVLDLARRGRLPAIRIGRRVVFLRPKIEALLRGEEAPS